MANKKLENQQVEEVEKKNVSVDQEDYEELSIEDRLTNLEKKANSTFALNVVILVVLIISLVFTIGGGNRTFSDASNSGDGSSENTETVTYDTSDFEEVDATDIAKLSEGKAIVVWVGRQSCGYCAQYAPHIAAAAKDYGFKAYYINLANYVNFNVTQPYVTNAEEFDTLSNLTGKGEWETFAADNVGGTPLTLIVKDNKVIGGISGYTETDYITAAFKDAGIKKK